MNDEETAPEYVLSVLRNHYPEERISKIANRALLANSFVRHALNLSNQFWKYTKAIFNRTSITNKPIERPIESHKPCQTNQRTFRFAI